MNTSEGFTKVADGERNITEQATKSEFESVKEGESSEKILPNTKRQKKSKTIDTTKINDKKQDYENNNIENNTNKNASTQDFIGLKGRFNTSMRRILSFY